VILRDKEGVSQWVPPVGVINDGNVTFVTKPISTTPENRFNTNSNGNFLLTIYVSIWTVIIMGLYDNQN